MDGVLRAGVRFIDRLLSASYRIIEISDDPGCIARVQLTDAPHPVDLGSTRILKGEPVLGLHLRNHRVPRIPPGGPNLEWALGLKKQLEFSFELVADFIQEDRKFALVRAVYGSSALFSSSGHTGGLRLIQHLGFTVLPYHRPLGKFGDFWENLFSWWLMWAYNATSLDSRKFWRLQRSEIWISAPEFLRRYGKLEAGGSGGKE